jgi:hypothetical protein
VKKSAASSGKKSCILFGKALPVFLKSLAGFRPSETGKEREDAAE